MDNYQIKFYDFLLLYNSLLLNLAKKETFYSISIYYLDNNFNIKIVDKLSNQKIFKYDLNITKKEYDYLSFLICYEFIQNHDTILPFFKNIQLEDACFYYQNKNEFEQPIDYEKSKIHVLKNKKFEINLYYFKGLNKIANEIHEIARKKMNNKDKKVYKKESV